MSKSTKNSRPKSDGRTNAATTPHRFATAKPPKRAGKKWQPSFAPVGNPYAGI